MRKGRKGFLPFLLIPFFILLFSSPLSPAFESEPRSRVFAAWSLPLVDSHAHLIPHVSLERLVTAMDESGVIMALLSSRNPDVLRAQKRYPKRFIPSFRFESPRGWPLDPGALPRLEEDLKKGLFKAIGEVHLRAYANPIVKAPPYNIPVDSPPVLNLVDLAAKYRVPLLIHGEAEFSQELTRMLGHNRGAKVIWAHAGGGGADIVRQMLEGNPNLYADLSARDPWRQGRRAPILDNKGILLKAWKELLEDYSDRFLVGLDAYAPGDEDRMALFARFHRQVLGQLSREAAEKIAYKNALKLLGLLLP